MFLIVTDLNCHGELKRPVEGNLQCWYGNFKYVTKDLTNPKSKLLQRYNKRDKKYGNTNVSVKVANKAISEWCEIIGIERAGVNNMWARKSFIQTALKDLQLPAQQVMEVSGHKSEIQMRKDYRTLSLTDTEILDYTVISLPTRLHDI